LLKNLAHLVRFIAKFFIERPPGLRHLGPGTVFGYAWSLGGARWIEIAENCDIRHHVHLSAVSNSPDSDTAAKMRIGRGTYIGPYCLFIALENVTIGAGCVFSERVLVCDNAHGFKPDAGPIMSQPYRFAGPVSIGDHSFIGFGACILPGAKIGNHCVVGANSVVTGTFEDFTLIAGNPARAIRRTC